LALDIGGASVPTSCGFTWHLAEPWQLCYAGTAVAPDRRRHSIAGHEQYVGPTGATGYQWAILTTIRHAKN
jgi:hypothetical protein